MGVGGFLDERLARRKCRGGHWKLVEEDKLARLVRSPRGINRTRRWRGGAEESVWWHVQNDSQLNPR